MLNLTRSHGHLRVLSEAMPQTLRALRSWLNVAWSPPSLEMFELPAFTYIITTRSHERQLSILT